MVLGENELVSLVRSSNEGAVPRKIFFKLDNHDIRVDCTSDQHMHVYIYENVEVKKSDCAL